MDTYRIKVKKLNRETFSTIFVWLENAEENDVTTDNIKEQQLTLAWVSNHEGIQRRLKVSGRDTEKLIKGLLNNFQDDFSDVIINLYQVISVEQVMAMIGIVAKFIGECVMSNNRQLG